MRYRKTVLRKTDLTVSQKMVWDLLNKPGTELIIKSSSIWVSTDLHSYNLLLFNSRMFKGCFVRRRSWPWPFWL